jgi:RNA polymerase sigma factor (sigma-70 family)
MKPEPVIRQAARPLISRLVPPLELEDLYQVGRLALWEKGRDKPEAHQVVIARAAMIDEIRRHRWSSRKDYGSAPMQMANYSDWSDMPEGITDCHAASMIAVRQCLDRMLCLAERERLILACLAAGMDQQEVAAHIGLSPQRVGQLIAELRAVVARYL